MTTAPPAALDRAVDAMADGVLIADARNDQVTLNPAAREMLGIPAAHDVTATWLKESLGFYPFDLVASAGGIPMREEIRVGERVLHSVVTPLMEGNLHVGAVVVLRDLGETRDLARRRSEFAQLMSHELRAPLTSVAGALDIVLAGYAGELNEKQQRYIDMARQATTQMNVLVDQLLDLARAQTGSITVALGPMYLDQLTRTLVERYRESARARQVKLELLAPSEPIAILGDSERLAQVLGNLLANAIKFAPPGGQVEVALFGPTLWPDAVGVSVFNDGSPIGTDDRERVFEPFSASSRKIGGSGMGLSISRAIIEAHGGRMWAEAPDLGSKFVFTLPAKATVVEPVARDSSAPIRIRKERALILIVDDDRNRALLLKGNLLTDGDEITLISDVDTAITEARTTRPDVIIIAASVPDARALVEILEHDPDTRKIGKLVLCDVDGGATFTKAGADEVLEGPLLPYALRGACHRLIDSDRRAALRVLVVDDDSGARIICREVLEQSGYVVRDVSGADAAVGEARRFRPDLVLLDVSMPEADGFGTAARLRADASASLIPFIFLSARADTADKIRAFRSGAEDYMVKPFDPAELAARVGKALARHAREVGASPTTQLPGGDAIEAEIERRIREPGVSSVACYLDLDNLKAFNDYYGYAKADAIIRQTGSLIRDVISQVGSTVDFIGHIAGDDFVFITDAEHAEQVCRLMIERFDAIIPLYYDRADRVRGYIATKDRWGVPRDFPIMTVSIAAVSLNRAASYGDLATLAAAGKHAAKAITGSAYVHDQHVMVAPSSVSAD